MLPADDMTEDFEEMPNDDEAALSDKDRHAMEIFECTINCVDEFKSQTLNLHENIVVAKKRLEQQRQSWKHKPERITKYCEKITRLETQGYVEKVDPKEPTTSGNVWHLLHFAT